MLVQRIGRKAALMEVSARMDQTDLSAMSVLPSAGSVRAHLPVIGDARVYLLSVQHLAEPAEGGAGSINRYAGNKGTGPGVAPPARLSLRRRWVPRGLALPLAMATAR